MKYCSLFRLVNAFDSLTCWLVYIMCVYHVYTIIYVYSCMYIMCIIYMYIGILAAAEAISG